MSDSLRLWPHIRARISSGPFGPFVAPYVAMLREEGYSPTVVRLHVRGIDIFGRWLSRQRLCAKAVDQVTLDRFASRFRRRRSPSRPRGRVSEIVCWVRHFVAFLWARGVAERIAAQPPATAKDQFLRSFREYLDSVKGLAPGTQRIYSRYAAAFVETAFSGGDPNWPRVRADDVVEFVRMQAAKLKASTCRAPVTATRALLRYLELTAAVGPGLSGAVPTVRQWKHTSLPAHLCEDDVERVLACCGDDTAIRRRDRAILLLLARLGLRASEVAGLRLDDIDWRQGRLVVRARKSGSPRVLPLPLDAGEALASYLRAGRPKARSYGRTVFLRGRPPLGPLAAGTVSSVAAQALRRAGVAASRCGSHVFRHSVATGMVRRGASFKEVADVLGHARLETTAVYAKLDLETLRRVALPWPGGAR